MDVVNSFFEFLKRTATVEIPSELWSERSKSNVMNHIRAIRRESFNERILDSYSISFGLITAVSLILIFTAQPSGSLIQVFHNLTLDNLTNSYSYFIFRGL